MFHNFSVIKSTWLVCQNNPTITKMTLTPFLLGQKVTSLVTLLSEITKQWHLWDHSYPGKKDRWILWSLLIQFSAKIVILLGRHRSHLEEIVKLLLRFESRMAINSIWLSNGNRKLPWRTSQCGSHSPGEGDGAGGSADSGSWKNRSTAQVLEKRRHQKGQNIKSRLYLTFHNFMGVVFISEMCCLINIL